MQIKYIDINCNGDMINLVNPETYNKRTKGYYFLRFIGLKNNVAAVADIRSITKTQYVVVDKSGMCAIPDCFSICDEVTVRLVFVEDGVQCVTNEITLRFK